MFKINVGFLIGVMILTAQLQLRAQTNDETGLVTIELEKTASPLVRILR